MKTFILAGLLFLPALKAHADPMAGAVVTSSEWDVKRGKDTIENFSGKVHYHSGPNQIWSDWARFDHALQNWIFRGRVKARHVEESGTVLNAYGNKGAYNQATQKGWLIPSREQKQVLLIHQPINSFPGRATADKVNWVGTSKTVLTGRVHARDAQMESWSDKAVILENPEKQAGCSLRRVTLSGSRPVAVKSRQDAKDWAGAVKADQLKTFEPHPSNQESSGSGDACGANRYVALGHARGWIVFKNSKKHKKKKSKSDEKSHKGSSKK